MNYQPLTEEEFLKLETELNSITTFLPEGQMRYIWEMYNKVRNTKENQPCACRSSAKHWTNAVNHLKEFVNEKRAQ